MAIDYIDDGEPLIICNGDQIIDADIGGIGNAFYHSGADAGVITFPRSIRAGPMCVRMSTGV